jgi:hypothetical protein
MGEVADFTSQAKAIFRLVVCGGADPIPARFDATQVQAHCDKMNGLMDKFRGGWLKKAAPFLGGVRPPGLPDRVVYPFGGGDLVAAIATFPDAAEYTLLSIEAAGDPRPIDDIVAKDIQHTLAVTEHNVSNLFLVAHNRTDAMAGADRDRLPGQLIFALVALRAHGMEPVRLTYFQILEDGALHYVTPVDIAENAAKPEALRRDLFENMEILFVASGASAEAPPKIYRHLSVNLDNLHLTAAPGVLKHLEAKGRISAMTKAASYLLWGSRFTMIRDYLLAHMAWMISDSTGIAPADARAQGFLQETYGRFDGPFLNNAVARVGEQAKGLWRSQPTRDIPMPYGYPDNQRHWHMMVTKPAPPTTEPAPASTPTPPGKATPAPLTPGAPTP